MRIIALIILSLWAQSSHAEFMGSDLAEYCADRNTGFCLGYVSGVVDAQRGVYGIANKNHIYCLPPHGVYNQAMLVVSKYLKDHPEELHFTAESLVASAMLLAFPCKK